ncbi:MAG: MCE family protein [Candidatus Dormibacteraeota bacterium]|nr:MCE family protein [Candidatus Dormibacteraeota bacterium]MBV9525307.1 MCE family protein [Candidatus Dormibacteraeota bacterium]
MKRSRTFLNGIIIGAFTLLCLSGMEYLAFNIGQGVPFVSNYTVHAVFSDADGVPTAADVRVSGVDVGKVVDVNHDPSYPGETVATMQITDTHAVPVYSNGYAKVKPKTLLGEKFIDLTVGNGSTAEAIPSGGFLGPAQTGKDVSNDEIFNAFTAQARSEQQQVLQELDAATFSRAGDIQSILPQLTQVVANLQPVARVYEKDQPQVDDIFVQLNTIMQTMADEHTQLAGVLSNGNVALNAIVQKDQALIGTLQEMGNVSAEFNNAMAPTVAQQRQAIQELKPALDAQNNLLNLIVGPQSTCGGHSCGIDEVFTGTLLGNINYPNDQLTVSSGAGELVTDEWDSMFSQPAAPKALNVVLSFHCDAITQTISGAGLQNLIQQIQSIYQTINQQLQALHLPLIPVPNIPLPNPCSPALPLSLP